ncbi:alpha-amylase family glycosyl hydrolase [Desulfuromonas carbonis]|uniref:alpha-amylase family glycosyl hydrolase n=1 Tax=Desulfuromonas sp. DDH964 TaxID=1823759 RepID=UPI00078B40D2|nr:alpha-amylase family glycosyl hydrolase [Desulfuromonas sp. DDH964]AMV73525.1 glycoside hydrolase [Desulfuromonas sp. DDH964]
MTALPPGYRYFPLGIPLTARALQELALPRELRVPPPARRLYALREVANRFDSRQASVSGSAAQLNLLALLCSAQRLITRRYLERNSARLDGQGLRSKGKSMPLADWPQVMARFGELFPPPWEPAAPPDDLPDLVATELLVLAVQSENRAAAPYRPLFDPAPLDAVCPWRSLVSELDQRLAPKRQSGRLGGSLLALLREPLAAAPDSLAGQLGYIRAAWGELLPEEFLAGLEIAFAVLAEEERDRGDGGPGPLVAPGFSPAAGAEPEPEAFSRDADWMSSTVLVAKSVYVWLDQLSRTYQREVVRLDQIPGEELDRLARWGFSALWLIGLWRRSDASRIIKQRMGNPEAVASAYSLDDYQVADDLGGDAALATLEAECRRRGIRLACDVVPNHTGIDSRWVREHPDWYIQLDHPPYPGYSFSGPDLSSTGEIELRIEDGYWDHSDAAVVFQRRDRRNGEVRYLYHGNDGTHMPWNDTAQLNFLLPQVREAMIATIIRVARRFRIIRFDAAMTLAKRHFQRLWFPLPGGGAGVPSRAEHAMSREAFESLFPLEFWREVVDRVAAEVPDTLLLAEAFWLMEGYFVRTLGMHRVYNSAFMHMLKQEENAKYRGVLKNILEFNPEILKRFVNFMNNPDEATAVEQFGKGDKYFGVAVLLATLPGLPMFGHGQIEGLREKYGMEYRRAYLDEAPDAGFIAHHEAQICPLLQRRWLFSEAAAFELYDFESGGNVNEDVFAYSNACGGEHTLVVYHNRSSETAGRLRRAVAKAFPGSGEPNLRQTSLAAALGVGPEGEPLWRWREERTGSEFLLGAEELRNNGLFLQLGAYDYRVFTGLRPQPDPEGHWRELAGHLAGRGVADLDRELGRWRAREVTAQLRRLLATETPWPLAAGAGTRKKTQKEAADEGLRQRLDEVFLAFARATGLAEESSARTAALLADLAALQHGCGLPGRSAAVRAALAQLRALCFPDQLPAAVLVVLLCLEGIAADGPDRSRAAELLLDEAFPEGTIPAPATLVRLLLRHHDSWTAAATDLTELFAAAEVGRYLLVHQADGVVWFNRERAIAWLDGLTLVGALALCRDETLSSAALGRQLAALTDRRTLLLQQAESAGYRLDRFLMTPPE